MEQLEQDINTEDYAKRLDICATCEHMKQTDQGTICDDANIFIAYVAGFTACNCPKGKW